jgi:DNA-binding GntR family transcriptional regulator
MKVGTGTRLRDEIENEILMGSLRPGDRLDELSLAERFGVSRTPVREALVQLASAGLVDVHPRRSAVVAQVSAARLVEMFEVMAELEGMAGRLAARRHTQADLDRLLRAHKACREAANRGDSDAYYYENEEFHHAIYAASHNDFLVEQCAALHRRLKPYRRLQLRVRNRVMTSLSEHDTVVEAITRFDADRAQAALQSHVRIQGERFGDLIASLQFGEAETRRTGQGLAAARSC